MVEGFGGLGGVAEQHGERGGVCGSFCVPWSSPPACTHGCGVWDAGAYAGLPPLSTTDLDFESWGSDWPSLGGRACASAFHGTPVCIVGV